MKARILMGLAAALLVGGGTAVAQQDPAKCATTKVAGATIADLPGLLADAACFARNASSAITSQKLRLDKATELAKAPPPAPTPTPKPPVGDVEEPELGKDLTKIPDDIPSNFDISPWIATGYPLAPPSGDQGVGAFRFICQPGQLLRDDPIVFPGQPGKSHLHQFFGNTLANASSTYKSLRTTGESTCINWLNRSAYWIPAMLDGKGKVVRPDYVSIYYKRQPNNDPSCTRMGVACVDIPRGLRMIFGYDMVNGTPPTGAGFYDCQGPTAKPGHYRLIADVAPNCGPGNQVGFMLNAPNCWDGKHLDSADHRSHVAYASYWKNDGILRCPDTHGYIMPAFTMGVWYSTGDAAIGAKGSVTTFRLSSDTMNMDGKMVEMPAGMTGHGDFFGAWDESVMGIWMSNCINKLLSCNAGDLGDGRGLKQKGPFLWKAEPRLVDIPPVA